MGVRHDEAGITEDVEALFEETDAKGNKRFGTIESRAMLAVILIEIARRQELEALSLTGKQALFSLLEEIGIDPETDPKDVKPRVQAYFKKLGANPAIFVRLERILKRRQKADDRLEAADASAAIYNKITSREAIAAPGHDEAAPEGSKQAQTLAQSLGVKVRI